MRGGGFIQIALAVAALAFSAYQYYNGKQRAARAEHKSDVLTARRERKDKLMQLREYGQVMQVMNRGRVVAEQTILKEQRKKDAEEKFYGKPV